MMLLGALAAAAFADPAIAAEPTPISLDDIHRVADLSDPVFAPDGSGVYYTLSTHNLAADKTVADIWRVDLDGGEPINVTKTADASEWRAELSADGAVLAYLSDAGKDEETQVWIRRVKGGKAGKSRRLLAASATSRSPPMAEELFSSQKLASASAFLATRPRRRS